MADELPDLSQFDKYLDDEDLEKLERSHGGSGSGSKKGAGGSGGGSSGGRGSGGGGASRGGPRRWLWLLIGAVLGVLGALFLPDLVRPYLPPALRLGEVRVSGLVVNKRTQGERLLLTVDTERGASLVTFTRRVPEIDLLVAAGDSVTLGLGEYAPLVENPTLAGVRKGRAGGGRGGEPGPPDTTERPAEPTDSPPPRADSAPGAGPVPDTGEATGSAAADTTGG